MICGALSTLNEEASEDVANSERPSPMGLPTGEMLAAAAQIHLATIRESSEFGSPSDDQKINNLLQFATNNNYNDFNGQKYITSEYNRSASSHSLQSLGGGGLQMSIGSSGTGGSSKDNLVDRYNIRHGSMGGETNFLLQHPHHHPQRHHSVGDDLLYEPLTPTSTILHSNGVPTVVIIPNANTDDSNTDDTKL